ncbi:MAG: hypothetical protein COA43_05055 [Robiginitomaculum sp.]|nr:MAG: hypothetical protein COA43_05055 [Robiginitomaculum sp.]
MRDNETGLNIWAVFIIIIGVTGIFLFYYFGFLFCFLIITLYMHPKKIFQQSILPTFVSKFILLPMFISIGAYFLAKLVPVESGQSIIQFLDQISIVKPTSFIESSNTQFSWVCLYYSGLIGFLIYLFLLLNVNGNHMKQVEITQKNKGAVRHFFIYAVCLIVLAHFIYPPLNGTIIFRDLENFVPTVYRDSLLIRYVISFGFWIWPPFVLACFMRTRILYGGKKYE